MGNKCDGMTPEQRARVPEVFVEVIKADRCARASVLTTCAVQVSAAVTGLVAGSWLQSYYVGDEAIHAIWVSIYYLIVGIFGIISCTINRPPVNYGLFMAHFIMHMSGIYPAVLQFQNGLSIYQGCRDNTKPCPDDAESLSLTCFIMATLYFVTGVVTPIYYGVIVGRAGKIARCKGSEVDNIATYTNTAAST